MASRHWLYFGGFVITGVLLVGVGLIGVLDALSVLSGNAYYGEEAVLLAMLGEAAEWVVVALALGLLAGAFLAATVVSVLRSASLPRSDRLVAVVERLERTSPLLRRLDISETVEPTREDRKRRLRERYVAGEIDDDEFEAEMERVMSGGSSSERPRTENETAVEREDRP
ncbi:SHOCT domain-containing protein [Halosolutus gelatinilyticus]|uniref:SHOCT domain-containing protein n=1 Tax=Halosolutus gelatinilyticus TaxID=2931975 RepID=UPI001FF2162C|nr:SHOCT domain-containing protein [Halosolutus gelatinilyticus]